MLVYVDLVTNINALTLSFQRASTTAFAYVNHEYAHQRICRAKKCKGKMRISGSVLTIISTPTT